MTTGAVIVILFALVFDFTNGFHDAARDLPLLINQWANVMRWEMRQRLFLRTAEPRAAPLRGPDSAATRPHTGRARLAAD